MDAFTVYFASFIHDALCHKLSRVLTWSSVTSREVTLFLIATHSDPEAGSGSARGIHCTERCLTRCSVLLNGLMHTIIWLVLMDAESCYFMMNSPMDD